MQTQKEKKPQTELAVRAFIFWAVILFVNTTFEYFVREPLISNFSFLLGLGLAVFFLTERLVKWLAVAKTRKTLR